jgi:hypothetical protein
VQVAIPFAMLKIRKMIKAPSSQLLMPLRIFGVPSERISEKRRDEGFAVWPPKFHILPIFLDRSIIKVTKVEDTSELLVPTSLPHPI